MIERLREQVRRWLGERRRRRRAAAPLPTPAYGRAVYERDRARACYYARY